ncbi:family 20 glycosylhydrolase [Bacteroides fragilis]
MTAERRTQILGVSFQMWRELILISKNINKYLFSRIAAYAEIGWSMGKTKLLTF